MVIIESILETVVENINNEVKSIIAKIILAVVFVIFYLFIVAGIMTIGFGLIDKNIFLGSLFILVAILIFVFFLARFIIIYNKRLKRKLSFLSKLFKVEKKK